jgi:L-2,4-diaminobutyrate decarboxylase
MLSQKFIDAFGSETYIEDHMAIQQVLDRYLNENINVDATKTIKYITPESEYEFWTNYKPKNSKDLFETLTARSIKLHNRKFLGHQVSAPMPITGLMSELSAILNNGMAVYEMGAAATAIEKVVIDQFKPYFGYDKNADGIFTSGGTIANLTAMLCARSNKIESSWVNGTQYNQYAVMVSSEAHYCIDRAIKIMGWGENGCILIPVDNDYRMRIDLLEEYYLEATNRGVKIIGVVGSAPTTSTGKYDDLNAIGKLAKKYDLWFHVDAAHGGPVAFTEKYKYLLDGIEMADSITVDCHKMMMTPALTTMLFFKNGKKSYNTFAQQAQYLWGSQAEEWHNMGKRTMECTKLMMATRIYAILQLYGIDIISEYVTHTYDMGHWFADQIVASEDFELATQPHSNIVCFRYKLSDKAALNKLNNSIRLALIEDGDFYIVQTKLKGDVYLRVSIMNAFTRKEEFQKLLNKIRFIVKEVL